MVMRGQRFHIDLSSEDETDGLKPSNSSFQTGLPPNMVADIKERVPSSDAEIPPPPKARNSETGFPLHERRNRPSAFRKGRGNKSAITSLQQQQQNAPPVADSKQAPPPNPSDPGVYAAIASKSDKSQIGDEGRRIDEENKQRIAQMSNDEIEDAQQELMAGLSPSLIERLLKKANIDEGRTDDRTEALPAELKGPHLPLTTPSTKKVTFKPADLAPSTVAHATTTSRSRPDPDLAPSSPPPDLQPASLPLAPHIHFPQPPAPPVLDPADPDFLTSLHSTYFPSLPSDPNTLAWMAPLSPTTDSSPYSSTQSSLPPSAIRFDFRGHLLPPRLASQIPAKLGLHHHASAPEAAGYTIPELAHLARSAFPAQRCIAYQTLGRVLYRLGRGDFGDEEEELAEGLWKLMEQGRVVEGMLEAAGKGGESGNRSCWVTATEAIWLWRKGGGRRWKAK